MQATLIFYESPKRLARLLADMARRSGRGAAGGRLPGTDQALRRGVARHAGRLWPTLSQTRDVKGEIVVLVDRAAPRCGRSRTASRRRCDDGACRRCRVKDAAALCRKLWGSRKIATGSPDRAKDSATACRSNLARPANRPADAGSQLPCRVMQPKRRSPATTKTAASRSPRAAGAAAAGEIDLIGRDGDEVDLHRGQAKPQP